MKLMFLYFLLPTFASAAPPCAHSVAPGTLESLLTPTEPTTSRERAIRLLEEKKRSVAYPDIPDVTQYHLPPESPRVQLPTNLPISVGVADPVLEEARELKVYEDFKPLSDVRPRKLSASERAELLKRAEAAGTEAACATSVEAGKQAFLKTYIDGAYDFSAELKPVDGLGKPRWKIKAASPALEHVFAYAEEIWSKLVRETPEARGGSLLPSPYPIVVAAGRFQENYYWDTYFGVKGLLATGRLDLSQMQVENFLSFVRRYGFVPNGGRDYYLSRSQLPFLSSLVREVYEASLRDARERRDSAEVKRLQAWLAERAYPLMVVDYQRFWMNPRTHYDAATGLNHHWDELNLPRPERHAFDREEDLGETYRDVRAAAESGLDFTEAFQKQATHIAGVLLNSMLFKTERDLAWAARETGQPDALARYEAAAEKRRRAIEKYLWDPAVGHFANYNLKTRRRVPVLEADTFAPLFVGLASPAQAKKVRETLKILEKPGGIMASDRGRSTYQWDGPNGWAPMQVFAIQGLLNYGYREDAERIARAWVNLIAKVFEERGHIYERMDVVKLNTPHVDSTKYPAQEGFFWTNGSLDWALVDVLGAQLQ